MVKYWPIWAKKGSELGQNCQNHVMLVRSHNKTFFQLSQRCWTKIFLKISKLWSWRVTESNWTKKRVKIGPKRAKTVFMGLEAKTRQLFHSVKSPEHSFSMKFPNFVPQGQILANLGQKSIRIGPKWPKPCHAG